MKANEIQIGDWIEWMGNYCKVDLPLLMTEYQYNIDSNNVKPIPLITEILEKNGFKQADAFRKGYGYDFPIQYIEDIYPIYLRTNGIWNIQCAELIDIKYVHELQHVLRLCGLNELANDFKIE